MDTPSASPASATIVLIPGYWLGGWAWDAVVDRLRADGRHATAVTLPGLDPDDAAREEVALADQVAAVRAVIDGLAHPPVVVAHSGGGAVLSGALDAAPGSVRRAIYVDSGPSADGAALQPELPAGVAALPLPSWDEFTAEGVSLEGLSDEQLASFRSRAVPHPARIAREPIRLVNPARRDVPTTIIACSIPSATILQLARSGQPMFAEVTHLTKLDLVDLPTGHWPMWSRPDDLARAIASAADQ